MRTIISFTSAQVSSRHQTLYRVLCLSLSLNGKAYPSPPPLSFPQDSIAWKKFFINPLTASDKFLK